MERITRKLRQVAVFLVASVVVSCGGGGGSTGGSNPNENPGTIQNMASLGAAVLPSINAAPITKPGVRGAAHVPLASTPTYTCGQEWALHGSTAFSVFVLIGDPTLAAFGSSPDGNCGGWGTENIQNNLSQANMLKDMMAGAGSIATNVSSTVENNPITLHVEPRQSVAQTVASPFPFPNKPAGTIYDYGAKVFSNIDFPLNLNGVWKAGDTFSMIGTGHATDKDDKATFEGDYTSSTGALRLNKVAASPGGMLLFMELTGNTNDSSFTVRVAQNHPTEVLGHNISVVAKGKSKGANNWYVIKFLGCTRNGADCLSGATPVWFCVSPTATDQDWKTFIGDGSTMTDVNGKITHAANATSFTGDCATYATAIAAMTPLDESDVPTDINKYYGTLGL